MAGEAECFSLNATATTTWTTPLIAHQSRIPIPIPVPLPTRLDGHPDSRIRYTTLTANRSALELLNDVMLGQDLPTSLSQGWSNNKVVLDLTSSAAASSSAAAPSAYTVAAVGAAKPTPTTPRAAAKLDRDAMLQDFAQRMALVSTSLQETRRATEGMAEEDGSGGSASRDVNLWTLPGSAEEEEVEEEEEEEEEEGSEEQQEGDADDFERLKKRMELLEADLEQTRQALKLRLRDVEAAQRPCFLCNQAKHLAKFCPLWTGQESSWRANLDFQDYSEGLGDVSMEGFDLFEFEDSSL